MYCFIDMAALACWRSLSLPSKLLRPRMQTSERAHKEWQEDGVLLIGRDRERGAAPAARGRARRCPAAPGARRASSATSGWGAAAVPRSAGPASVGLQLFTRAACACMPLPRQVPWYSSELPSQGCSRSHLAVRAERVGLQAVARDHDKVTRVRRRPEEACDGALAPPRALQATVMMCLIHSSSGRGYSGLAAGGVTCRNMLGPSRATNSSPATRPPR